MNTTEPLAEWEAALLHHDSRAPIYSALVQERLRHPLQHIDEAAWHSAR